MLTGENPAVNPTLGRLSRILISRRFGVLVLGWVAVVWGEPAWGQTGRDRDRGVGGRFTLDERFFGDRPGSGTLPILDDLPALSNGLSRETDRLLANIGFDLGGSSQGRNLERRARALQSSAQSFDRAVRLSGLGLSQNAERSRLRALFQGVERAHFAFEEEFQQVGGFSAVETRITARRVARLVGEIRNVLGFDFGATPVPPGLDLNQALRRVQLAESFNQETMQRIEQRLGPFSNYRAVIRDLDELDSRLRRFESTLGFVGFDPNRLRRDYASLPRLAESIADQLQRLRAPRDIVQTHDRARLEITQAGRLLGLEQSGLPGGGFPGQSPNRTLLTLTDAATNDLQVFLSQLNVTVVPEGFQIRVESERLLADLTGFRQLLDSGGPGTSFRLERSLAQAERSFEVVDRRVDRVSGGQIGPNIARLKRVGATLRQIRAELSRRR